MVDYQRLRSRERALLARARSRIAVATTRLGVFPRRTVNPGSL